MDIFFDLLPTNYQLYQVPALFQFILESTVLFLKILEEINSLIDCFSTLSKCQKKLNLL